MSQGQHRDLSSTVSSFEDYLQTVSEKTGAEMALLAALPALALGLPEPEIAAWERFGRGFGMLVQVYTDTCDIVADPPGRDLLGGKRTAPVLHALTVLEGDERASFDVLLAEAANGSEDAARAASRIAVRAGALRAGLTLASYLRVKALAAAPRKPDQDPRCKSLSVLIHSSLPNPHQSGGTR
jgi:geranylgeranyl pyrophosphate synthase